MQYVWYQTQANYIFDENVFQYEYKDYRQVSNIRRTLVGN